MAGGSITCFVRTEHMENKAGELVAIAARTVSQTVPDTYLVV